MASEELAVAAIALLGLAAAAYAGYADELPTWARVLLGFVSLAAAAWFLFML